MEPSRNELRESLSPTCSFSFFDCLAAPSSKEEQRRASNDMGIEREMKIMYQQPHLVPPMKLTVYDDLPRTPGLPPPSAISSLMSQGRSLASRASERASLSIRKKSSRPRIGNPHLIEATKEPRRTHRRLELSIYLPENRLSDLPEFDQVAFADDGEIQLPARALLRPKSEEALSRNSPLTTTRKITSMYEETKLNMRTRQNTTSSIISTSRPPSEYDALHSHPVSTISRPGVPPQLLHQPNNSVTVLSPIQDEFTTPPSSAMIDGTVTGFPSIDAKVQDRAEIPMSLKQSLSKSTTGAAPAPLRFNFNTRSRSYSNSTTHSKSHLKSTSQTQNRVANWVNHSQASSFSSSYSTMTTMTTTSMSFSEHRRKRSQFYLCQPYLPNQTQPEPQPGQAVSAFTPPKPLPLHRHNRHRTTSVSTAASTVETVDTNIMSLDDGESSATSVEAPVIQDVGVKGKSFSKPIAFVQEVEILAEGMEVKELNGGLVRSPGVGLAF